jgi:hypothetical protein
MLLAWLFLAIVLTVLGAAVAILTQDASEEHERVVADRRTRRM